MSERKKWTLISLLGERYILDILDALFEGARRFADLAEACPNEKTRTAKLRKLVQEIMRIEDRFSLEEK